MPRSVVVVALLSVPTISAACAGDDARQRPPQLIVHEGATGVRDIAHDDGRHELHYVLTAEYPAESVLTSIRSVLDAQGWQQLTRDVLSPETPSGDLRGWTMFFDSTRRPRTYVHTWSADWKDSAENVVLYSLRYDSVPLPEPRIRERPDNANVRVLAMFFPARVVAAMRRDLGIAEPLR